MMKSKKRLKERRISGWSRHNLRTQKDFESLQKFLTDHVKQHPKDHDLIKDLSSYGDVAIAYDFDFNITEHGNADASLAFKLPLSDRTFDLAAGGFVHATRTGHRTFKATETFAQLVLRDRAFCGDDFQVREKNMLYPITGSIGLRKAVRTFVDISEQGGGKDSFVDTLTFTTAISAGAGATIKINAVPNSFKLVSAGVTLGADRTDVHKVTISLAFPQESKAEKEEKERRAKGKKGTRARAEFAKSDLSAPFEMNTRWRARYNICVADARNREEDFKALRLSAPEVYCLTYADAFVPRYDDSRVPRWLVPPSAFTQ